MEKVTDFLSLEALQAAVTKQTLLTARVSMHINDTFSKDTKLNKFIEFYHEVKEKNNNKIIMFP